MQQPLVELVTVTMWCELMKLAVDCEMQAAQENNGLGFDEDNHIQYHIPNCNTIDVCFMSGVLNLQPGNVFCAARVHFYNNA